MSDYIEYNELLFNNNEELMIFLKSQNFDLINEVKNLEIEISSLQNVIRKQEKIIKEGNQKLEDHYNQQIDELDETYNKDLTEREMKCNNWEKACELACNYMCKFVIPCPDIHKKECENFCDYDKARCYQEHFYQQAKKENTK